MATAEKELYSRNRLVATLLRIKHDDKAGAGKKRDNVSKLDMYTPEVLAAAKADPELLGHFVAWNEINGKVRDSKVALPILALRGLTKLDPDLAENAVAHMLLLSPRDLVRAYDFNKRLAGSGQNVPGGFRRMIERGLKLYLDKREGSDRWWDRTVLQHRESMKRLYRLAHKKPSVRAQAILFDREYPARSIFAKVAKLHTMTPSEAAGVILEYGIPFDVAVGSVAKAKDKDVALALIEGMTGNQVITNTQMLQRLGVMNDPSLKAAYDAALERAKADKKVETLKAGEAAKKVKGPAAAKLSQLQTVKTEQLGSIEGDWLVLGDCSGSMRTSIELARKVAGLIAERVSGHVYLVFFNTSPTLVDVTGHSYEQIVEKTRRISAGGGTSIGCGVDYLRSKQIAVTGIAIVSDGGDNTAPRFVDAYPKYCAALSVEPTAYLFHVSGETNALTVDCKRAGIQLEEFEMGSAVDYYSLPNIIKTLRANRYALVDEILAVPLLTMNQVFERRTA